MNGLSGKTVLNVVPSLFATALKHYFELVFEQATPTSSGAATGDGELGASTLKDDLKKVAHSYDQMFALAKDFMETASRDHTIEDLQATSKIGLPTLLSGTSSMEVTVPKSCCDQAAEHLIKVLGDEEATKAIVGGTKWWQIRGVEGVDGEWIVAKKGWNKARRRAKSKERREQSREKERFTQESDTTDSANTEATPAAAPTNVSAFTEPTSGSDYTPDMDEQRCILFLHGGGYYFGSINQERSSIQRFARKIGGRVFAINYRLSPQYPFPCAIQDALAAYLYLIRPPPEAKHKPVKPEHIVIMGDSAGGGLSLATLQVIRDSGLPQCGGGVLISPWCDLNHTFPSIHSNTETDVIPRYGLSMHKPSPLWPPPEPVTADSHGQTNFDVSTSPTSTVDERAQSVSVDTGGKRTITLDSQVQFYTQNHLLSHPLVSPCNAYLGGLPPLFFTAGDNEVLRDEIIHTAHRAADPSNFRIPPEIEQLYPKIREYTEKNPDPTVVHLQVYDGCAHILPILFAFTTPAKYCFRAIANFCRFATKMEAKPEPQGYAGHYSYKANTEGIIRERVSIKGLISPFEPKDNVLHPTDEQMESNLTLSLERYKEGKAKYDRLFSGVLKDIKDERQSRPVRQKNETCPPQDETPPPSSVVSRRNTWEVRELAEIVDLKPKNEENLLQGLITLIKGL